MPNVDVNRKSASHIGSGDLLPITMFANFINLLSLFQRLPLQEESQPTLARHRKERRDETENRRL